MAFAVIFLFTDCFPQSTDSLKKNSFYSFHLNNGSVIQGKLISFDSIFVLLKTKNGLSEIRMENILKINKMRRESVNDYFTEFKKPDYSNFLIIGSGFISQIKADDKNNNYYYSNVELNNGFSLSINYTGFISRIIGVRAGFSYTGMNNKDGLYDDYYSTYRRTGGALSQFVLNFNILAGMFYPERKINFYGLAGFGIGTVNSSTYQISIYHYNSDPEYQFLISYGIGAGISYKMSEKIALQTEVTYDVVSPAKGFYVKMYQLGIKAGIIFINF